MANSRSDADHTGVEIEIGEVVAYRGRRYVLRGVDPLGVAEPLAFLAAGDGRELCVPLAALRATTKASGE